jgi:phage FluMu gp28-like protein
MFACQTGKTYATALEVVEDCLEAEAAGRRSRWVWLSSGERQAREAMEEAIKPHCRSYGAAFEALEYTWEGRYKAVEILFPAGSWVTALPANPDTARGYSDNVMLDEFATHRHSRQIWGCTLPGRLAPRPEAARHLNS